MTLFFQSVYIMMEVFVLEKDHIMSILKYIWVFVKKMSFTNNGDDDYYVLIIIIIYYSKIKRPLLNYSTNSREPW